MRADEFFVRPFILFFAYRRLLYTSYMFWVGCLARFSY